jgi:hypothetical protein
MVSDEWYRPLSLSRRSAAAAGSHCWRAGTEDACTGDAGTGALALGTASHTTTTPRLSHDASRLSSSLHATPRTGALCAASAASSRGGCALQLTSTRCTARAKEGKLPYGQCTGQRIDQLCAMQACMSQGSNLCHSIRH